MNPISNLSDVPKDYARALRACRTRLDLLKVLAEFAPVAADAMRNAPKNDEEWLTFLSGLQKESRGQFAGTDWHDRWGDVLMPELLVRVSIVSTRFGVPWGVAFIRMREVGVIATSSDGVMRYEPPTRKTEEA